MGQLVKGWPRQKPAASWTDSVVWGEEKTKPKRRLLATLWRILRRA